MRPGYLIVGAVAVVFAFTAIQGQRSSSASGRPLAPADALIAGLTHYNLAYGVPQEYRGLGIVGNVLNGILFRMKGADYFMVITEQVPNSVPFQQGRTLWQPILSTVPGAELVVPLRPEYRQLSLGRYVNQTFISGPSRQDPSSQSMTYPGDLYLNFGAWGVLIGMIVIGGLLQLLDKYMRIDGPVSAGAFAFAGIPMLGLERNLAYTLVTTGIRIGIVLMLYRIISLRTSRHTDESPVWAAPDV